MPVLFAAHTALAQLPTARLNAVFPAGGRQNSSFEVTLSGSDLDGANRLTFNHAGITAAQVTLPADDFHAQPRPAEGRFTVTIAADVPPGTYEARAVGKYGVTNPRFFAVDNKTEINETEPNNQLEKANEVPLGAIVNGQSNGADQDFYRFTATKGQRLLIDCQARRIDSRFDPAIVLYDAAGNELLNVHDGSHRDTLLDYTVPADGDYLVEVHDFIYAGGSDYFYRLEVDSGPHVDFVLPPAGPAGSDQVYEIYGRNLPGGKPAPGVDLDGRPLEVVTAKIALPNADDVQRLTTHALIEPAEAEIDAIVYRHRTPQGSAKPVLIGLATAPLVREQEPNNVPEKAQALSLPCECVGQFYPLGDQDWFTFDAKKGDTWWIEVISQRQGHSADPYLLVQQVSVDKNGQQQVKDLQQADDVRSGNRRLSVDFDVAHDDPIYRFTAPADGTYRVLVRDLYFSSRGDPRFVYRLCIHPEQPDFRLAALPKFPGTQPNQQQSLTWTTHLRKGGSDEIEVVAFRRDGFDDEIAVTAEGLPPGITAQPATIAANRDSTIVVLTAAENAAAAVTPFRIVGKAKLPSGEVTRPARCASIVWEGRQNQFNARSRMASELVLSVSEAEPAPFTLEMMANVLETSRAGKLEVPIRMTQRGDFKNNVTLSPVGLPRGIQAANQQMNVGPGESKFVLNLPPNAPQGAFSFHVLGTAQHSYRRNPEAVEAAEKHRAEVEKIVAERQAALKTANDKKSQATKTAQQAEAEKQQTIQAIKNAASAADKAATQLTAAKQKLAQAQAAVEKDSQNQSLANSLEAAKQGLAVEEDAAKKATEAKAAAEKAQADAASKAKSAAEAKTAAEKEATEADAKLKAAGKAKTAADKAFSDAKNAAQPRNRNIGFPSSVVTVKVAAAPMTLALSAPPVLKQGEKIEVPVTITRLFGFTNQVQISVSAPGGVSGLSIPQLVIPENQTEGKLMISANDKATSGNHELKVQANLQFNNQGLQVLDKLPLTVEKAEKNQ
ncbi:MAG TPA: pre-peptidase C-terminal domain-containing protein [Pirellulales bacterium]